MDGSSFIKVKTRSLFIQFLMLSAVQHGVRGVHCPSHCVCEFDDIMEHNKATCTFNKSKVDISWGTNFGDTALEIICADEFDNYQHDCNELPQFNINSNKGALLVTGCAASIMKCAHKIFAPVSTIKNFEAIMMTGSFTADDLTDFDQVYESKIHMKNGDSVLQAVTLNALKSMERFKMKGGNLKLDSNVLKLPKLNFLMLEENNIRDVPPNAFSGLPKLKHFYFFNNSLKHLDENFFRGLDSLTNIFFVNNTLNAIDPAAFSTAKQLSSLISSRNKLKFVPNGLFTGVNNLREIIITNNLEEITLDTHAFANLPYSVKSVRIANCNVKFIPEYVFDGSAYINEIVLGGTPIGALPPKIFATTTGLMGLDLRANGIQKFPDGIFSELKQLEAIDLSYNPLSELRGDIFKHNTKLKEVRLKGNNMTYIDPDIFKGLNILILDLSSNKLQRIISNTPVQWTTGLFYLNDNELTVFEEWFSELGGLTQLHLSGNKIKMIKESQIYKYKGDPRVYLNNNSITEIVPDTSVRRGLNTKPGEVILHLSNNPIKCDCFVTALLKEWYEREILYDYEDVTCDNEEKSPQSLTNQGYRNLPINIIHILEVLFLLMKFSS